VDVQEAAICLGKIIISYTEVNSFVRIIFYIFLSILFI